MTHSEMAATLRAAGGRAAREYDRGTYVAWRTVNLMRARKVPPLARLLRKVRRVSESEQAEIRAEVAAVDAELDRLVAEAEARKGGGIG